MAAVVEHLMDQQSACPQLEQLERYATDPSSDVAVAAHISSCASCAERLEEVRSNLQFGTRLQDDTTPHAIPEVSGFTVQREIGRGGMGHVYQAQALDPPRPVAIKLLAHGLGASDYAQRLFQREAEALARLRHDGIATVYGAGQTNDGQRYLAMEYVDGLPLDRYLLEARPHRRQRLQLLEQICAAVHHAHQRGVLHRDLKPANILVEAGGHPKVLDFGLARIHDDDSALSQQTEMGRIQGTLRYMSPEQAAGASDEVDARSDVYALGVILFEMLTGQPPYEIGNGSLIERLQVIRNQAPTRPRSVTPDLPPDLEAIVLKALEKDPQLRYASVAQLGDDLRRFRNEQPVTAHPQTLAYQLYKFTRRHRLLVGLSTAAVVALVTTTGIAVWQAVRATSAEQEARNKQRLAREAQQTAERSRDESEAVTDFLGEMLTAGDPADRGVDVRVVDILDDAAETLATRTDTPPAVAVRLHMSLGQAYLVLSQTDACLRHYQQATDLAEGAWGANDARTLRARYGVARSLELQGDLPGATELFEQIAAQQQEHLGEDHPDTLATRNRLASALMVTGDVDERIRIGEDVLRRSRSNASVSVYQVSQFHRQLGRAYSEKGDSQRAEQHYRAGIAVLESAGLAAGPDASMARLALGTFYKTTGRYDDARELQQAALDALEHHYGPDHHRTISTCRELGGTLIRLRQHERALPLLRRAEENYLARYGPDNRNTLYVQNTLSYALEGAGRKDEALALAKSILERRDRTLGSEHPKTLESKNNLGGMLTSMKRYDEAHPLLQQALAGRTRVLGATHYNTLNTMQALGQLYIRLGRYEEAEDLLYRALEAREQTVGRKHPRTIRVLRSLAELMRRLEDFETAEDLYREVQQLDREMLGPSHPNHLTNLNNLSNLYRDMERYAEALELVQQVHATRAERYGANDPRTLQAQWQVVRAAVPAERATLAEQTSADLLERVQQLSPEARAPLRGLFPAAIELTTQEDWQSQTPIWQSLKNELPN